MIRTLNILIIWAAALCPAFSQEGALHSEEVLHAACAKEFHQWYEPGFSTEQLIDSVLNLGRIEENLPIRRAALNYCTETEDYRGMTDIGTQIATTLEWIDRTEESLDLLRKIIEQTPSTYHAELARLELTLGNSFAQTDRVVDALNAYLKSLKHSKEVDSLENEQTYALGNMTDLYYQQSQFQIAWDYLMQSHAYSKQLPEPRKTYNLLHDYSLGALILGKLNKLDSAEIFIDLGVAAAQRYDDVGDRLLVHSRALELWLDAEDQERAQRYLLPDSLLAHKSARPHMKNYYSAQTARYYLMVGQNDRATSYLKHTKRPVALAPQIDYFKIMRFYHRQLGNDRLAVIYGDSLLQARSKKSDWDQKNNLALIQAEYDNKVLASSHEIIYLRNQRQRHGMIALGCLLFLLGAGAIIIFRSSQVRARKNAQLQQAEADLLVKNSELQKYINSNIQLERFAHIAAHDLKAPLRTVASFTGLLKKKIFNRLTDKEKNYLSYVEEGSRSLGDLVEDLLVYSKANSQSLVLEKTNLLAVIASAQQHLEYQISAQGAKIELVNCKVSLICDSVKLRQVFQNLISNAIKFHRDTEPPEIKITCEVFSDKYQISVADNGIGIDAKYREGIFEMFTKLHALDEFEGTGIGLAICREIVNKHQGKIWVDSIPGFGSTFYFTVDRNLEDSYKNLLPNADSVNN